MSQAEKTADWRNCPFRVSLAEALERVRALPGSGADSYTVSDNAAKRRGVTWQTDQAYGAMRVHLGFTWQFAANHSCEFCNDSAVKKD
jgi:hypothetical protein